MSGIYTHKENTILPKGICELPHRRERNESIYEIYQNENHENCIRKFCLKFKENRVISYNVTRFLFCLPIIMNLKFYYYENKYYNV